MHKAPTLRSSMNRRLDQGLDQRLGSKSGLKKTKDKILRQKCMPALRRIYPICVVGMIHTCIAAHYKLEEVVCGVLGVVVPKAAVASAVAVARPAYCVRSVLVAHFSCERGVRWEARLCNACCERSETQCSMMWNVRKRSRMLLSSSYAAHFDRVSGSLKLCLPPLEVSSCIVFATCRVCCKIVAVAFAVALVGVFVVLSFRA